MGHPETAHGGPAGDPYPSLSERREQFGVGTTPTEIITMSGEDTRFIGGNSRGPDYHDTFIQNGMDHHEWDMESPPKGLGSHPRHTSQDSVLMQIPRELGRSEPVYPRDTSFFPSNERGKSTEYMVYQQCRCQLSSLQFPRETILGEEHGI